MSAVKNFLLDCSGIDKKILEQCPSDENKYIGIGATVLFTGILAFFSAGYALYTVFDSYLAALAFGAVWGLMIFNLDRYIVSSMKSQGSWWRDFGVALPRLALAVLLALVISKPLELKIFQKEIDAELIVMQQEVFKEQEDKLKERYQAQLEADQVQIAQWKVEIADKTAARDAAVALALAEADGTGGTMNQNLGPIYRAKKKEADQAQAELEALLATQLPLIKEKEAAIAQTTAMVSAEIAALERSSFGGLAAQMEALHQLGEGSTAIYWANIMLILLFVAVETAPIFVKLISTRSPYDYLLHEHEHVFAMAHREHTTLLSNAVGQKVIYDTQVGTHRNNAQIAAEKELIDSALKQRLEERKGQPVDWQKFLQKKSLLE